MKSAVNTPIQLSGTVRQSADLLGLLDAMVVTGQAYLAAGHTQVSLHVHRAAPKNKGARA